MQAQVAALLCLTLAGCGNLSNGPDPAALPMTAQERRTCEPMILFTGGYYDNPLSRLVYPRSTLEKVGEGQYRLRLFGLFGTVDHRYAVDAGPTFEASLRTGEEFFCSVARR
ncbi:hypothetical protein [Deinococcus radiophilus]|uniref:Uncharacterized protein n=1 Tax=Deinococcus radiophilus TaxID=32062 RepID=A0A3S0KEE5_9DEIO|nr:hypothetical protein [Deinococcus radiophilus]RTR28705.1 hypothetical protein EJ104_04955 [Deinococcus radiophilus]UFA51128.1 hypothetical protein LMT64_04315 [Deinococcus radiophilus]